MYETLYNSISFHCPKVLLKVFAVQNVAGS